MINEELRLQGRTLFEERLKFGKKYIVYRSPHDAITHALMDGHTYFAPHCSASPRLFFTSTKGSSGKSRATQVSWFFVQQPILVTDSGASLIWEFNKYVEQGILPTIIYDEVQDVWKPPGNSSVQALLNSYVRGFKKIVWDGSKPIDKDLFCPVIMNGLTTKYDIPSNFLERCIQIPMQKRLNSEDVADFEFSDLMEDIGEELRKPRIEWSANFSREDIRLFRSKISEKLKSEGIANRELELWRPLCEYAYLCGDDIYESAISAAEYSLNKAEENKQYTPKEQLLIDIYGIFCKDNRIQFISSSDIVFELNGLEDSPWKTYRGKELNGHNLAFLLKGYEGIKPEKDVTGNVRGYYRNMFKNVWERDLGLDTSGTLTDCLRAEGPRGAEGVVTPGSPLSTLYCPRLSEKVKELDSIYE